MQSVVEIIVPDTGHCSARENGQQEASENEDLQNEHCTAAEKGQDASHSVEGILKKKPRSATSSGRNWMDRLFTLHQGLLSWFKVKREITVQLADVAAVHAGNDELAALNKQNLGYKFTISFKDSKSAVLNLACRSRGEATSWLASLSSKLKSADDAITSQPNNLTSKSAVVFVEDGSKWVQMTACLRKESLLFQKRKECGVFPVHKATVDVDAMDSCVFHLKGPDEELSLRCQDEETCKSWMSLIQSSIEFEGSACAEHGKAERELRGALRTLLELREVKPKVQIEANKKVLLLSIDGGGARGVIPCIILERIVHRFPDFLSRVDVVGGTSVGAMVAMALAFGHEPRVLRDVIEQTARAIFSEQQVFIPVVHARWSNRCLSILCDELFGEARIKDATKKVAVTAFKLDNHHNDDSMRSCEVSLFHNFSKEEATRKHLASDCVMRSSAAPSYFSSWQGYIDGGTFAPDPALLCLTHVMAPNLLNVPIEHIFLLSLSTGNYKEYFSEETNNWGYWQWAPKLAAVLWTGMISNSQTCCQALLGTRLHRVDPVMDTKIALDEPSALPDLVNIATLHDLTATFDWIQKNIYDTCAQPNNGST